MPKIIGIIPARGGSKGVKRKNIRQLNGRPLIDYAIASARQSRYLSDLYITTDDDEIADFARKKKVQVIQRGEQLSDDNAKMVDVVYHALQTVENSYQADDILCLMQPTCPLRTVDDIDGSIEILLHNKCDAVVGMTKAEHEHPERLYQIDAEGLSPLLPGLNDLNRQQLPEFYIRNGIVYTLKVTAFLKFKTFSPNHIRPLEVPHSRSVNIDTEEDFFYAEFLLQQREKNAQSSQS